MKLFSVALHCVKVTWRGGAPKIAVGVSVGPLAADTVEEVQQWAERACVVQFPAHKGWEMHRYTITETPDSVLDAVRPVVAAIAPEPVKTKQKGRSVRQRWLEGDDDE